MKRWAPTWLLLAVMAPVPVAAETAEDKGRAIAEEADRRDLGWRDSRATLRMVLRNRHGQESTRELRLSSLETTEPGYGDRSLIVFDSPGDVRGTALLSHTKVLDPDDQWLYLPALKRVKRVSSRNKSGPFVGSEFAFEDLVSQEVDKYTHRWLRDEACGELQCFVLERIPRYENSGYTRQIVWLDQGEYRSQKVEFYDRKGDLLKTLHFEGYAQYADQYWRPGRLRMLNHQSGKSTDLNYDDWRFQTGLPASLFSPARLKRQR